MKKPHVKWALGLLVSLILGTGQAEAAPLKIGYSDWPGWVAWQVAIDKGWLKQAGVDATFEWFDYSASMDAFSGGKSVMIMLTDYSNGNDMIVAKPNFKTLKDLKGQKIGIEMGLVEHLLLLDGLQKNGMSDKDVTLVNAKTNETPQVLGSGQVAAIGAWQPNSGMAMKAMPGAHPVYTSAQAPGLIYDVLTVSPASLASRKADWQKVVNLWGRVVAYINDPKTQDDAVKIMSARVGLMPAAYKPLLGGTKLLSLDDGRKVFKKADGLGSLYGSSKIADNFNVKYGVYKTAQNIDSYIDPSLTEAAK